MVAKMIDSVKYNSIWVGAANPADKRFLHAVKLVDGSIYVAGNQQYTGSTLSYTSSMIPMILPQRSIHINMGQDLSLPKLPSGVHPTLPEAISQIILELNTSLSDEKRLSEFTYLYSFVKELRSNTSLIQGIDSVNSQQT